MNNGEALISSPQRLQPASESGSKSHNDQELESKYLRQTESEVADNGVASMNMQELKDSLREIATSADEAVHQEAVAIPEIEDQQVLQRVETDLREECPLTDIMKDDLLQD